MKDEQTLPELDSEFEGRVRFYWDELSRTERQIAEYILRNEEIVPQLSVQMLAQSAGVGAASVIRFCKSLDYKGFSELKFHLARRKLIVDEHDIRIGETDTIHVIKQKVLQFDYNALEKCVLEAENGVLERISDAIVRAGKVYVVGCGSSSGVAQAGAALFLSLGIPAFSVSDALLQLRSAAFLEPGDVLIALCYSGYDKEIGDVMYFAREAGAVTVLLTSHRNSLLGKYADHELFTPIRNRDNSINASSTLMGKLILLQVIQAIIKQKNIPALRRRQERLRGHAEMKYYDVRQETIFPGRVRTTEGEKTPS